MSESTYLDILPKEIIINCVLPYLTYDSIFNSGKSMNCIANLLKDELTFKTLLSINFPNLIRIDKRKLEELYYSALRNKDKIIKVFMYDKYLFDIIYHANTAYRMMVKEFLNCKYPNCMLITPSSSNQENLFFKRNPTLPIMNGSDAEGYYSTATNRSVRNSIHIVEETPKKEVI